MASLTAELGLSSSSRRIIDPQNNKGPTFLEGLANLASGVVGKGSDLYAQNQVRSRQSAATAKAAADQSAESDAAGLVLDAKTGRFDTGPRQQQPQELPSLPVAMTDNQPVPVDSELEGAPLPPDVTRTVTTLQRAQAAEAQGRAPAGSGRIHIEAALADLRAKYPDRQDIIYKTLKDAGIDHYLFREAEIAGAVFEAEIKAETDIFNTYVDAAVKAGAVLPGTDPHAAAAAGQRILSEDRRIATLKAERELAASAAAEGRAQANFDEGRADREMSSAYAAKANQIVSPLWNTLTSRISSVGFTDEAGNVQSLERVIPLAQTSINQIYANLIDEATANGAPAQVVANLRADRDDKLKSIDSFLTGDSSVFAVRKRALESLSTTLKMNTIEAMPVYLGLSEVFGQGAVNDMFAGGLASVLPAEVQQELAGEIKNIQGVIDTSTERMTMAKLAGILRGQLNIDQMTENEARKAVPTLGAVHTSNAKAILQNPTMANQDAYINSGFNLANAALELQPGNSRVGIRDLAVAQTLLFSTDARAADVNLGRSNPAQAQPLIQAKRAAATHSLETSKRIALSSSQREQGWSYVYQTSGPRQGTYQAVLDNATYNRYKDRAISQASSMAGAAGGSGLVQSSLIPTYEQALRTIPQDLAQQVGGMNYALGYLVETNQFDETTKAISNAEARRLFALGEVPQSMRDRTSEAPNQRPAYEEIDNKLIEGFTAAAEEAQINGGNARLPAPPAPPKGQLQTTVKDRAERMGLNWGLVNRVVARESTWDPNAENSTTQARGLFQINDNKTNRTLDENINDGLNFLLDAQKVAERTLGRAPQDWETYVAHQQGSGGGGALLNPANATKKAVDVLIPAYRGNERLARQAITANGGNLNMTAAEFLASIRNFFNGG